MRDFKALPGTSDLHRNLTPSAPRIAWLPAFQRARQRAFGNADILGFALVLERSLCERRSAARTAVVVSGRTGFIVSSRWAFPPENWPHQPAQGCGLTNREGSDP